MTSIKFTEKDIQQLRRHQLTQEQILEQLTIFKKGIPPVQLVSAANIGNGIFTYSKKELQKYTQLYEQTPIQKIKFVPASGAASRMFKDLAEFLKNVSPQEEVIQAYLAKPDQHQLVQFFNELENFAFYKLLLGRFRENYPHDTEFSSAEKSYYLAETLLKENQLDFLNLPKGLVPFHPYHSNDVTAFEEHLYEASKYAAQDHKAQLHFTVAEESLSKFEETFQQIKNRIEKDTGITFQVTYSFQKKSTDTLAVDHENIPFRNPNGNLCLRPGGHGALIENLNEINVPLIFIKNIDNVAIRENVEEIAKYKKALAGILLELQTEVFAILEELETEGISEKLIQRSTNFVQQKLQLNLNFSTAKEIKNRLHRPIRVCGMVENKGAPGGGPFWVKDEHGEISLQIVEGAQISQEKKQQEIAQNATHFNPVDIVCGIKDFRGNKFDLTQFVNPHKGFISEKYKDGKKIKALELPGLWNGGMAYWNTVFVEVPAFTFNPVKTVNDLLQPAHQPAK